MTAEVNLEPAFSTFRMLPSAGFVLKTKEMRVKQLNAKLVNYSTTET